VSSGIYSIVHRGGGTAADLERAERWLAKLDPVVRARMDALPRKLAALKKTILSGFAQTIGGEPSDAQRDVGPAPMPKVGLGKLELASLWHEAVSGLAGTTSPGDVETEGTVERPSVPPSNYLEAFLRSALTRLRRSAKPVPKAMPSPRPSQDVSPNAATRIGALSEALAARGATTTIGLWDLRSRIRLSGLVDRLNAAQTGYTFFEVFAGVPAGLIRSKDGMLEWAEKAMKRRLRADEEGALLLNTVADEFFPRAEAVRGDLGVDYLLGLTPSMVAGQSGAEVYWNHISSSHEHVTLASSADFREFARSAGRPVEAVVGVVAVAALLVSVIPKLEYHDPNRHCLFDYNANRVSLADVVRDPRIDDVCLAKIPTKIRGHALALVKALSEIH
jgi:hypothetical protein